MKRLIILAILALGTLATMAQEGAPATLDRDVLKLPPDIRNLCIVDGQLYGNSAGILIGATYRNGKIINFDASLDMMKVDGRMDYLVRNPETGILYYTIMTKKGESLLYEYDTTGKKPIGRQVKLGKFQVYHPTFSRDGSILVFSSPDGLGFGGMDLWYTRQVDGEWEEPKNFGHKVNTSFDEVAPCMYGDYLIFSSNGREVGESDTLAGRRRLYVARLMASRQLGDTVMRFPIGRSPIQALPYPYNSESESMEMAADKAAGTAFWIESDDNGRHLHSMKGSLAGALAEGYVQDQSGKAIPMVKVSAYDAKGSNLLGSSLTDEQGYYSIMLNPNANYLIVAEKSGYFGEESPLTTTRGNQSPDIMITEHHVDFELEKLYLGKPYSIGNIFGPQADIELSKEGEEAVQRLVTYMCENPDLKSTWTLWSRFSNGQFSQMVTNQRIQTLKEYVESRGVKGDRLVFVNGDFNQPMPADQLQESRCDVILSN